MSGSRAAARNLVRPVILLAWLAAYAWLLAGDRYQAFLSPRLRPLLYGALALLVLLLLASVVRRPGPRGGAAGWLRAGVLVLPLLFLGMVQGRALSSYAADKRAAGRGLGTIGSTVQRRLAERPPGGALTLAELVADVDRQLGHRVQTEGLVFHKSGLSAGHFVLFRFKITCCAADAQPLAVLVAAPQAGALAADQWVRVDGVLRLIDVAGEITPCLQADAVVPIPPPKNPYLLAF
jgi:uncharacterized repeat protein (TIGR03943 family)